MNTTTKTNAAQTEIHLSRTLILILAMACGIAVANLYYNQPLLAKMAHSFQTTSRDMGIVSTCTQMGYALGMLLFVPLADIRERRSLISTLLVVVAVCLVGVAIAQNLIWLDIVSFAVGVSTVVPQVIVPMVAQFAEPAQRGRVIGIVMSGLLVGILLARTVSGFIGSLIGWRGMYWLAAAMMLVLALVLRLNLPKNYPTSSLSYGQLFKSIGQLIRRFRTLREASVIGAMSFGTFSVFWTTLAFLLEGSPYHLGSRVAGLFGLVGVAGAMIAPVAGRLADHFPAKMMVGIAMIITLLSFVILWLFGHNIWGLLAGVVLLDMGVQGAQILNQTRIYSVLPEARSRLNTVYMVSYFIGGAVGSSLGSAAWYAWNWNGVCAAGVLMISVGIAVWGSSRIPARKNCL